MKATGRLLTAVVVLALVACGSAPAPTEQGDGPCPLMLELVQLWFATVAGPAEVYQSTDAAVVADTDADHEAIRVMSDFLTVLEGPVSPVVLDAANRFPSEMGEALAQDTDAIRAARRDAADAALAAARAAVAAGDRYLDTCRGQAGHPPEDLADLLGGLRASLAVLDAESN